MPQNSRDGIAVRESATSEERGKTANTCTSNLGLTFPYLIDGMDNSTERNYAAWPDRLYVVNKDGTLGFKSAPGPSGFRMDQLAAFLKQMLP